MIVSGAFSVPISYYFNTGDREDGKLLVDNRQVGGEILLVEQSRLDIRSVIWGIARESKKKKKLNLLFKKSRILSYSSHVRSVG